jgi:hypothetical protein
MAQEIWFEESYKEALGLLVRDDSGETEKLLGEIILWEETNPFPSDQPHAGWEWYAVHADPRTLNSLVARRILSITLKTNNYTYYRMTCREAVKKALKEFSGLTEVKEEVREIPGNLFDIVIGHEDKKEILRRCLNSEKPLHTLLWGSPASAKTLILEELRRLPGSHFVLGSSLSKAGLYEILFLNRPKYLILDELDKVDDTHNLSGLLSLMERGHISETKYKRHKAIDLETWVFASANNIRGIPEELMSRFVPLQFRDYTPDEFVEVVTTLLREREGLPDWLALHIAKAVLQTFRTRDVRDAIQCARLLREPTKEDVNQIIGILKRQM